jgi:hypothetical protein
MLNHSFPFSFYGLLFIHILELLYSLLCLILSIVDINTFSTDNANLRFLKSLGSTSDTCS